MNTPQDALGEKISAIELMHVLIEVLREEIGFNDQFAELHAQAISEGLRRRLGTQRVYVPAPEDVQKDSALRDRAIRAEFNGRNLVDIMTKYRVSRATVYRALSGEAD